MPVAELEDGDFADGTIDIISLVHKSGLVTSRSEARRAVEQGGVTLADEKVADIAAVFDKAMFEGDGAVLKRGKKNFRRMVVK